MKKTIKTIAFLLSLMVLLALLCGCSEDEISDTTESGQTTQETTEETAPGYEGEKGKPLTVDFTTPGVIAENAEPLSAITLTLCDVVLQYPYSTAKLLESGWNFYSENVALQTVSANTEASVMGFSLYRGETAYAEIGAFVNSSDSEAAVSDCNITCITLYTAEEGQEDGPTFVLPGGITEASTAADVIAVFGPAIDNPSFESVQTGASLLYYANHEDSLINYAFGFREDGTIASVMIFS